MGLFLFEIDEQGNEIQLKLHLDVGLLDQLAKTLKFLTIEFAKFFGADVAWLATQTFEFGLYIGQFDDA